MQHEEFAERTARRLEAVAGAIEHKDQLAERGAVSLARVNELRVAAHMVRDMARVVTRAENSRSLLKDLSVVVPSSGATTDRSEAVRPGASGALALTSSSLAF